MKTRVVVVSILLGCAVSLLWFAPKSVHAQLGQPVGPHAALITITAGTPIQVTSANIVVSSLMVQPLVGSSAGIVYVCAGILPSTTPTAACAATQSNGSYELAGQLSAATATVPGPVYSFYVPPPGLFLNQVYIDGGHSGDPVLVTWYVHQ